MTDKGRYAAFISYSHKDSAWADWLLNSLERYRVPKRLRAEYPDIPARIRPVFRDRDELPSASDLGERISQALAASDALVVICSPAAAQSKWVNQEILTFKQLNGEDRIFCLIVDGEPGAGDASECFPEALRFHIADTGELTSEPAEPIAADGRKTADGKPLARLKIMAGLLKVGLDDLRQREQQRKQKRMAVISVASIAGMALTLFLAVSAMIARSDAERRQQQAEDLVEFMLTDLKQELDKVGRLDAMGATAEEVMSYFGGLAEKDMTDQALAQRAKAFRVLGEIYNTRLEWDQAQKTHQLALDADQALLERHPDNDDYLFNLGQSHFWVGYAHHEAGRYEETEPYFLDYLRLSETLFERAPDNPDWAMEVSYGYTNLAGLYEKLNRQEQSLTFAEQGVEYNQQAVALAPDDDYYREELAGGLVWVANAQRDLGQLDAALKNREEALLFYEQQHRKQPQNRRVQEQLATSLRGVGLLQNFLGQHQAGLAHFDRALTHLLELVEHDPSNDQWQYWLLDVTHNRVFYGYESGMVTELTADDASRLAQIAERTDSNLLYQLRQQLAVLLLHILREQPQEDASLVDNALATIEQLAQLNPGRDEADLYLGRALVLLDDAGLKSAEVSARLDTAIGRLKESISSTQNPLHKATLYRLLIKADRASEARSLLPDLEASSYRSRQFIEACQSVGDCAGW